MIEKVLKPMHKVTYITKDGYKQSRHYANKVDAQSMLAAWIVSDLLPINCERFYYVDAIFCVNCSVDGRERLRVQVLGMLKSGKSTDEVKAAMDIGSCAVIDGVNEDGAVQAERQARNGQAGIDAYVDILEGRF